MQNTLDSNLFYGEHMTDNKKPALPKNKRMSIDEIEAILLREDEHTIEILPNGEVRKTGRKRAKKVLTMRENLGGEYAR